MSVWYNEIDPKAAAWLRELMAAGLIPQGVVDARSIVEVQASDLEGFTQCHFFAGIGGWPLALRRAGWADTKPVWTGSCPCQPFSLAGKQKGFEDERHLWPHFLRLITIGRPPILFGEQVASAAAWLRLVRSDLEALGYAVGAMPIEAASAGADHLRDRFWFVGDLARDRRGEGRPEHEVRSGRSTTSGDGGAIDRTLADDGGGRCAGAREGKSEQLRRTEVERAGNSGVGQADAYDARSQGRTALRECEGERSTGPDGMAHADESGSCEGWQQRSGEQRGASGDQEPCDWAIGADGKARRVKPGVRLLVNGFPSRVGLLRGFGNAIDPRPAAAFIQAASEAIMVYDLV